MQNLEMTQAYLWMDVALKALWQPFTELVVEMDAFVP